MNLIKWACIIASIHSLQLQSMDKGTLTVITGPMYSEKTGTLIRYIKKAQLAEYKTMVYSHCYDCRTTGTLLSRSTCEKIPAIKLSESADIVQDYLQGYGTHVYIDEVQFFDEVIAEHIQFIVKLGATVIVSGLDMNFKRECFNATMGKLLAVSTKVKKLTAVCSVCKAINATLTQRLVNDKPASSKDELLVIDTGKIDNVRYEPRCLNCHVLG